MNLTAPSAPGSIQHRLVFDDLQADRYPWIRDVDYAIRENPDCERGVMESRGWAYSNNGPYSAEQSPELLVLVSRGLREGPLGTTWYGHVFRFIQGDGDPCWISILVRTWVDIDAVTDEAALQAYVASVIRSHRHEPGYRQKPDDIASRHGSFEEAATSLADKIRMFRREFRDPRIAHWEEPFEGEFVPIDGPVPDSELCFRCWDVYGFVDAICKDLHHEEGSAA